MKLFTLVIEDNEYTLNQTVVVAFCGLTDQLVVQTEGAVVLGRVGPRVQSGR